MNVPLARCEIGRGARQLINRLCTRTHAHTKTRYEKVRFAQHKESDDEQDTSNNGDAPAMESA